MALEISTADADVRAACRAALAAEPVRNTLFSSVLNGLAAGAGWCALGDGGAVAARSRPTTPLALSAGWTEVDALVSAVQALPSIRMINGPEGTVHRVVARLGLRVSAVMGERLFRCPELRPPAGVAGSVRPATADDEVLLREWFAAFEDEAMGGARRGETDAAVRQALAVHRCWLWLDPAGAPVSLAREQAAVHGVARIGPVYTPPARRRQGYGSAVTAGATQAVLDAGNVPVLFTDLANPTSNAIYQRLGYRAVEDHRLVTF